ncbi:MAG: DUF362 domain-containing protein [Halanaerobiales bacterium]
MEEVAVKKCREYDNKLVYNSLQYLLKKLGGINKFISPGDKVLLKINLIMGSAPEKAVTTHPVVVEEMAKIIKEAGGQVILGDSPGGRFNSKKLKKVYKNSGLIKVAKRTGAELNYNTGSRKRIYEKGKIKKSFVIADYISDVDKIINMPKLKTHGLTMYTGAVKNLFGAIPGLLKGEYHLRMPQVDLFSEMLLDLALFIKPCLNIMDGIIGMEAEGPSSGDPRKFGYLLGSNSSWALDIVGIYILGIEPPQRVPLINSLEKRNLSHDINNIKIKGDKLTQNKNTIIPKIEKKSNLIDKKLPAPIGKLADFFLRPRPVFSEDKCTGCRHCIENCPVNALEFKEKIPEVDLDECIRCFCCQELCEYNAVNIKRPFLGRLLFTR